MRARLQTFPDYLAAEGVRPEERAALLADLDRLCHAYVLSALDRMGWRRKAGTVLETEAFCDQLGVAAQHRRLFERLLGILTGAGVLRRVPDGGFAVVVESDERPGRRSALRAGSASRSICPTDTRTA